MSSRWPSIAVAVLLAVLLVFALKWLRSMEQSRSDWPDPRGPHIGQEAPSTTPAMFAPGLVSRQFNERDASFTPDGTAFYTSVLTAGQGVILEYRQRDNGTWEEPRVAPFSGRWFDLEPWVAPDGERLYFVSKRPDDGGDGPQEEDADIWYVPREGDGWGDPVRLPAPVNTDANEYYPSLTRDGEMIWTASYEDGPQEDIWIARQLPEGGWSEPERVGGGVSTPTWEYNAMIAPDGDWILFTSHREDGLGGGDLYIAWRTGDGWSDAVHLPAPINSAQIDYCPALTPDGRSLIFTSHRPVVELNHATAMDYDELMRRMTGPGNGQGDLWWVDASVLDGTRP